MSLWAVAAGWAEPSTVDPAARHAWAANAGWFDLLGGDGVQGVVFRTTHASGYAWGANTGWLNLGEGVPANGGQYANTSGADFGVNHVGEGKLRGLAWSANLGWVVFEDTGDPRVDMATGLLSGQAWSANAGWLSLAGVRTAGPVPLVGPDAGERVKGEVEVRFPIAKLLANDHSRDGGALVLEGVQSPTAKGAAVSVEGPDIVYRAPAGDMGHDEFTYVVRGGFGPSGLAAGTVQVLERDDDVPGRNLVAIRPEPGGGVRVIFVGLPGRAGRLQVTEDLTAPVIWQDLAWLTADAQGVMSFLDGATDEATQRFYRVLVP